MMRNVFPNFLHIGAAKAASTWLYQACLEHPEIYLPPCHDNVNFFLVHYHRGLDWYGREYFSDVANEKTVGEFSNAYFLSDVALERIARELPDVRLSVLLRNPAERAYLHWAHAYYKSIGWASDDPATDSGDPLAVLPVRPEGRLYRIPLETVMHPNGWCQCRDLLEPGLYAAHLRRIYRQIPPERVRVLFYDDLGAAPHVFIRSYYAWLGVDSSFQPSCLQRDINPDTAEADVSELSPALRTFMVDYYQQDIAELAKMTGRDLSAWSAHASG
jgi:hypothetical protein